MAPSDIAHGQIGAEGAYDVKFEGGKLVASVEYAGALASAKLSVGIGADQVIDAIAKAIPGQLDDVILNLLKTALKSA